MCYTEPMIQTVLSSAVVGAVAFLAACGLGAAVAILARRVPRLAVWKLPRGHVAMLGLMALAATFAAQKLRAPS